MQDRRIDLAALVLRLTLGAVLLAHGLLKLVVFTPAGTAAFFEKIGLPGPLAYVVIAAELVAGIAIVVGWRTRLFAAAIAPILFGSALPHIPNGWMFSAAGGGWEYSAFLGLTAIALALLGGGRYALRAEATDGRLATA
ncbi:MAG: DoxX family protein [Burkholderiales bacterium]|nr:DoxX family protein [Burkholderiales bacterium]MCE7877968.1 DoxX family protein [Betaproteobacteria bacterium PRO3]